MSDTGSEENKDKIPARKPSRQTGHDEGSIPLDSEEIPPNELRSLIWRSTIEHYAGYTPPSQELAKLKEIDPTLPAKSRRVSGASVGREFSISSPFEESPAA